MNNALAGTAAQQQRGRDSFYEGRDTTFPPAPTQGIQSETDQIRRRLIGLNSRLENIFSAMRSTPKDIPEAQGKDPGYPDIATTLSQTNCHLNRADQIISEIEREVFGAERSDSEQKSSR